MKKLLIMGLTLTAFALISCKSKDKDPDEDGATAGDETTAGADAGAPATGYTITNQYTHTTTITVTAGEASITLSNAGGCAVVTEAQFATLKVQNQYNKVLCDSTNAPVMMAEEDNPTTADVNEAETPKDDDCKVGNYNVTNDAPLVLTSADARNDSADCKALGGTAEPAGDATPAEDGEGTDG